MIARQGRKTIRADLISRIPVGGDAVRAHDDAGDAVLRVPPLATVALQEGAGHGVGDEGRGDAVVQELVAREPRALVVGTRFGVVDALELVTRVQAADDSQRGAVTCRGQGA